LGQYENYFFKRLNGKITHLAIGKGIYIYLAICQPRYDFRKCLIARGGEGFVWRFKFWVFTHRNPMILGISVLDSLVWFQCSFVQMFTVQRVLCLTVDCIKLEKIQNLFPP